MLEYITMQPVQLKIVLILTVGFLLATILGYLSDRAKMSSILGYLLAGYLIGPYSPGFVADLQISEQLAEIGVILMMFGVGLHFRWRELMNVKYVAISGAIGQTLFSTLVGSTFTLLMGWSLEAALVLGISIGIASTVVLVRVLSDNKLLQTPAGYISLSWLICEDFIAVFALLLLPILAANISGETLAWQDVLYSLGLVVLKFTVLVIVMFTVGQRLAAYILHKIILTNSRELFSLSILALTFCIATGSALFTGTSITLGAFIAGMIVGQTTVRHQVSENVMPMKDAFVVIFFLSIGMLFNPVAIAEHVYLFVGVLAIITIVKPLVAFIIVQRLKYPIETSFTVALALAQVGEFSFIIVEEATKLHILPDAGYDVIVACAFVSISLNPLFFRLIKNRLGRT